LGASFQPPGDHFDFPMKRKNGKAPGGGERVLGKGGLIGAWDGFQKTGLF